MKIEDSLVERQRQTKAELKEFVKNLDSTFDEKCHREGCRI